MTTCGSCHGAGKVHCTACGGTGRKSRHTSLGGGGVEITPCAVCYGTGRKRCDFCGGRGQIGVGGGQQPTPPITFSPLKCPLCGAIATRGGFKTWQIVVAIIFFPMGLLALFAPRKPNSCPECGHMWEE